MITINGETWYVREVPYGHPALYRSDGSQTIGSIDDVIKTIFICETLDDWKYRKVLCHELVHAAMFSYDVNLSLEQEELIADIISEYGAEIIDATNTLFCKLRGKHYC
jgi:hypothetical protein